MLKIVSMRNDSKVAQISQAAEELGFSITGSRFDRGVFFFVYLFFLVVNRKKPSAVIVRYLNDHPILIRSLLLALNIIFVIFICRIFKIKVFWFLHNVDSETTVNFPAVTYFLRKLVGDSSSVIFVTDPLLVAVAKGIYPQWMDKIDFITFGVRKDKQKISTDVELMEILSDLQKHRLQGGKVLFCPTAAGDKYSHIASSKKLCDMARKNGVNYKVLMVGDLARYLESDSVLKQDLVGHEDIILLNRYVEYDADVVSGFIDAYWRSLSDQSVSYTLYEAASVNKPVLTLKKGFIGYAIDVYRLGAALDMSMKNFNECHRAISSWDAASALSFLGEHSWEVAARQINKYLSE